jgi:hypothetical protein
MQLLRKRHRVIPAKAGIQQASTKLLESGFRRNDSIWFIELRQVAFSNLKADR